MLDQRKRIEVCFTPGEYAYYKDEFEIVKIFLEKQFSLR